MKNLHKIFALALILIVLLASCTPAEEPAVEEPAVEEPAVEEPAVVIVPCRPIPGSGLMNMRPPAPKRIPIIKPTINPLFCFQIDFIVRFL